MWEDLIEIVPSATDGSFYFNCLRRSRTQEGLTFMELKGRLCGLERYFIGCTSLKKMGLLPFCFLSYAGPTLF